MPRSIFLTTLTLIFCSRAVFADSSCASVYASAVRNVAVSTKQFAENSFLFTQHCESNGELRKSSSGLDFTATIKAIDLGFNGSKAQASSRMQQFCKQRATSDDKSRNSLDITS